MKKKNSIVTVVLFVLTIGIVLGAGLYKNTVSAERAQFQAQIPGINNAPVVVDLGKHGWPKKLIQPGKVEIFTGHGPMGIRNSSNEELLVQVALKGFPGAVELDLPETDFNKKTYALKNALKPGQLFKMDMVVEIPKQYRDKLIGFSAEIQFLDQKNHTVLSSIPVHVVNSKYGDPYKELTIEPSFGNGSWNGKGNGNWGGQGKGEGSKNSGENKKGNGDGTGKADCH